MKYASTARLILVLTLMRFVFLLEESRGTSQID